MLPPTSSSNPLIRFPRSSFRPLLLALLCAPGGSRLFELHGLLKREVMIRRLKKDVLSQLPPKRRQVVRLPKPPPAR